MQIKKDEKCFQNNVKVVHIWLSRRTLTPLGLSKSALDLMHSYLSERKQCVKVGVDFSAWKNIY
jgi:hypothetical protein